MIVESAGEELDPERPITGIAGRRNFTILTIRKRNITTTQVLREALEITDRYHAPVEHITTFRPGVSGRLFKAIGEAGVNIRTIAQGADELSIIVGVDKKDYETAIRVLYDGFAG